ncbi:hypothetical protein [Sorangium sp. So ce426]|uniref:hypothetical protein n=1 Tax=Sorangium sp. So ce426 TaxID=3133312 RepID=UPI003F5CA244
MTTTNHDQKNPCLYCGDAERPKTDEHVLQRAFGTSLVLEGDVCGRCNSVVFSPLDTELVGFVRGFTHSGHPDVLQHRHFLNMGHSASFDESSGAWISVRRDMKRGQIVPLSQIVMVTENAAIVTPEERVVHQVRKEMERSNALKIERLIWRPGEGKPRAQVSIIRSGANKYLVRASSEYEADAVIDAIHSGRLFDGISITCIYDPFKDRDTNVVLIAEGNEQDVSRAVVKSAINFVCAAASPALARDPVFSDARQFALTGSPYECARLVRFAMDDRDAPEEIRAARLSFCRPGFHTMIFAESMGNPSVLINLYGQPFATVRLVCSSLHRQLLGGQIFACLFDYKAGTHRLLSNQDGSLHREFG